MKRAYWSTIVMLLAGLPSSYAGELTFVKPSLELTAPITGQTLNADFPFTNQGKEAITITRFESECSCMAIESLDKKLRIGPGESGTLRAHFQKGTLTGTADKTVRVWLEGDPADKPSTILKLRVHIPELISIEPKTARWELKGNNQPITVTIKLPAEAPAKIKALTSSNPLFTTELKTIEEGRSYEAKISCSDTKSKALGVLKIDIDSSLPGQQTGQLYALVK